MDHRAIGKILRQTVVDPACCASSVCLLGVFVAARSPYHFLDLVFAVGAQVFSETRPMETCEAAHKWSGSGRVLRRLPPPQNRTCEFPRIRLKRFKGALCKHPVDDGSSPAMDLSVTIGV